MLGKSGKWYCDKGPWVGGFRVGGKRARRIARAREKAQVARKGELYRHGD